MRWLKMMHVSGVGSGVRSTSLNNKDTYHGLNVLIMTTHMDLQSSHYYTLHLCIDKDRNEMMAHLQATFMHFVDTQGLHVDETWLGFYTVWKYL